MGLRTGLALKVIGVIVAFAAIGGVPESARGQTQTKPPSKPASSALPASQASVPPGVHLVAQMPAPGPARPFQFPSVNSKTLPNGLRVFVAPGSDVPAVTVALVLTDAGSIRDPKGQEGLAQLTASLLTQGTASRTAEQIARAIDSVGGSLSASADHDDTTVVATVVKKDMPLAMTLLSDVVMNPSFSTEEIERQRQQALSSLRVNYADTGYLASAAFARVVYGASPYGLPADGTPQSLAAISRTDIEKFHQKAYGPEHALLGFAGDVTPEEAFAAATRYFESWSTPIKGVGQTPTAPAPVAGLHFFVVDKPDDVQTQIRIGRPGIARNDPNYIPLLVTNRIFGGGYNSLLNTAVRLQKGLTYGANSAFDARRFGGSFVAGTFTRTDKTVEAVQLIFDLMQRMASGQISPEDLDLARAYLVGVYPIQTETPQQVITRVLSVAVYGLPADYNQTYQRKVAAVSLDQVKEMAETYFAAKNWDIVLVGNASGFLDSLKKAFPSASYEEIPLNQLDLLEPALHTEAEKLPAPTPATIAQGRIVLTTAAQTAGGSALHDVKSIRVSESGQVFSPQGALSMDETYLLAYPDRIHSVLEVMGQKLTQIFDGQAGWMVSTAGSTELPPTLLVNLRRRILLAEGIGIYQAVLAGKLPAQWIGEQTVQGQKVIALSAKTEVGRLMLYVDPDTRLLVGAEYTATTAGGAVDTLEMWSDFRPVMGLMLPFHIVGYQSGTKFLETTVKEVQVNVPVKPAYFAKPQPAEAPKKPTTPHP